MRKKFIVSSGWRVYLDEHIEVETDDFDDEEAIEEYLIDLAHSRASADFAKIQTHEYESGDYLEIMEDDDA